MSEKPPFPPGATYSPGPQYQQPQQQQQPQYQQQQQQFQQPQQPFQQSPGPQGPPGYAPHGGQPQPGPHGAHSMPPQQAPKNDWSHGFCDFFSPFETCLCGWCCPCVLFGRTQERFRNPGEKDPSSVNTDCALWCCFACIGAQWIYQMVKRSDMRDHYGIEGSMGGDCFRACCCPLCSLVQEDKEVVDRTQMAGGYQAPQQMAYP